VSSLLRNKNKAAAYATKISVLTFFFYLFSEEKTQHNSYCKPIRFQVSARHANSFLTSLLIASDCFVLTPTR